MVEIINTIRFSFPSDAARPSWDEIGNFVKTLNISIPDIDTAYKLTDDKSVCLKFKGERAFKDAVLNNEHLIRFNYTNGTSVEVQLSDASANFQYVRICGLPPEVSDRELLLVMGRYGKVKRILREKVPSSLGFDWFSGVRGIFMDVEKEIPPALHFLNWRGNVFYEGNKFTCFMCKQKGHLMNACPTKKVRSNQKEKTGPPSTYASVVNGDASLELETSNKMTEILSIERAIRNLEKDMVETEEVVDPAGNKKQRNKTNNNKTDAKRQLSIESDESPGGTLKKQNVNDESAADSDGNSLTDPQTVCDALSASETGPRPSTRFVINRGFTKISNYKK